MDKVIYTAIMGNYDQLKLPQYISEGWDYICFTDNYDLKNDFWKIRYIDSSEYGAAKTARWIKICPEIFLDCDLSVWVDGNFEIKCYLDAFIEEYHKGNFSVSSHGRDCTYDEAHACITYGKDRDEIIKSQMKGYRNQGFPEHFGMVATGLTIRNHGIKNNIKFAQNWWKEVRLGSKRDQLSFNYTLWKHPIDINIMDFNSVINKYFMWGKHCNV
jgi:hypothetical protein